MALASVGTSKIKKYNNKGFINGKDLIVVEEPLEIRLNYGPKGDRKQLSLAITMRTPGSDFELAIGFMFSEGIINTSTDMLKIRYCEIIKSEQERDNIVLIDLDPNMLIDESMFSRNFYINSSCGVCGKTSIESLTNLANESLRPSNFQIPVQVVQGFNKSLDKVQTVFKHTGGIHAAALFDDAGTLLHMREDIGRHNAVDKVIGACLGSDSFLLKKSVMFVSGRAGFELVQKCIRAGIPIMAAVGAPSSLAVELANQYNLTLLGFVRDERFNIYSHPNRIVGG